MRSEEAIAPEPGIGRLSIVRAMNAHTIVIEALVVPFPVAAACYPKVGGFVSGGRHRAQMIVAGIALGLVGLDGAQAGFVPLKAGLYFWAPLWQIIVVQVGYRIWFKLQTRPPRDVVFNWESGLVGDRALAMAICLLGIVVPVLAIGR